MKIKPFLLDCLSGVLSGFPLTNITETAFFIYFFKQSTASWHKEITQTKSAKTDLVV